MTRAELRELITPIFDVLEDLGRAAGRDRVRRKYFEGQVEKLDDIISRVMEEGVVG
jgi:hypothetical protein